MAGHVDVEDEENIACGCWPGSPNAAGATFGKPALYSYTTPAPPGYQHAEMQPGEAYYDSSLGEFILHYDDVRRTPSPEGGILAFFQCTFEASAMLAGWDRSPRAETR